MTNYTKTTDFAAKDSLPSGDSGKIIRGSEFETEFDNIATAVNSKADSANPTFTGTVTIDGLTVNGNTVLGNAATDTVTVTADIASNLIPSADDTYNLGASGAEWNDLFIDGTAYIDDISGGSISGTSFASTGNMTFGDNNKAIFGTGSDLQIYHNGSASYITDSGTGNLLIQGTDVRLQNAGATANYLKGTDGAEVSLFYAGGEKLTTTATGVDVTGTVTADGLTVDGIATIGGNTDNANYQQISGTQYITSRNGSSNGAIRLRSNDGTTTKNLANFGGNNDVIFYEDTGTTAKFFWDASTERLGIGTTSPTDNLHLFDSTNAGIKFTNTTSGSTASDGFSAGFDNSQTAYFWNYENGGMKFATNNAERVRIDASGNVGIGTDSPIAELHVYNGSSNADIRAQGGGASDYISLFHGASQNGLWSTSTDPTVFATNNAERMRIDSSGNLLVGRTSASYSAVDLHVGSTSDSQNGLQIETSTTGHGYVLFGDGTGSSAYTGQISYKHGDDYMAFRTAGVEAMRIDSSGNLLVGKTSVDTSLAGTVLSSGNYIFQTRDSAAPLLLRRNTSDGDIAQFYKDGSSVGSIGTYNSDLCAGSGDTGVRFAQGLDAVLPSNVSSSANRDAAIDLGYPSVRFKDLYLSGGVYLGGTAAANKLDDYEEGTFTPVAIGTTTAGTATYTNQAGKYTKVGNIVFIQLYITYTGHTGTGNLRISGLPFTAVTQAGITLGDISLLTKPTDSMIKATTVFNTALIRMQSINTASGTSVADLAMDSAATINMSGVIRID